MGYKLPKCARLSGTKDTSELFEKGSTHSAKPVRCTFLIGQQITATRVLVSAPKRAFKHAVDRNLLKRRLREAYRLNRHILGDTKIHLALSYTARDIKPYKEIEDAVRKILEFLVAHNTPCREVDTPDSDTGSGSAC